MIKAILGKIIIFYRTWLLILIGLLILAVLLYIIALFLLDGLAGSSSYRETRLFELQSDKKSLKLDLNPINRIYQPTFKLINLVFKREIPLSLVKLYYNVLGPEIILHTIEEDQYCHDKGHNIGRIIFSKTQDLNQSIQICTARCTTGCFHGVLMEFFKQGEHIEMVQIREKINSICKQQTIGKEIQEGVCVHGVGHALLYLSNYNIKIALRYCSLYKNPVSNYYCATGVFMEYARVFKKEVNNFATHFPCDENDFPAACYRYKIGHTFEEDQLDQARLFCNSLLDKDKKHGCLHGLGFSYFSIIVNNPREILKVCENDDSTGKRMCIEGAVGILKEYNKPQANKVCDILEDKNRENCDSAIRVGNFGMNRNVENYFIQ